jgi:hypothetical protein
VWLAIPFFVLAVVGLVGVLVYLHLAQKITPTEVTVATYKRRDSDTVSYFVTYLFAFMKVPLDTWDKITAFLIFFLILGFIYVNSNMIHINPMLNIFGYRIYELSQPDGERLLITRQKIKRNDVLRVIIMDDDIYLGKNAPSER